MSKRVGVLTSGGDCAGLNAAIRAITYHAQETYGWTVIGIRKGTTGLINRPLEYIELTLNHCDSMMLRSGGTMLGSTNKDDPFSFPNSDGTRNDRSGDFIAGYHDLGLDALIGIGGDGSMRILRRLAQKGNLNLVTIPKTIDNDLGHTEIAIGYATALDVATEALDRLQPTAASHQRVMVLEVMGRDAGHIAIGAGVAGGADVILIPEIPYTLENICKKIKSLAANGRNFALVIVAESVKKENGEAATVAIDGVRPRYGGIGQYLGEKIQKITGAETRVTALGHVQRGGQPSAWDRVIASAFGVTAVNLIAQNKFDRMVAWQHRQVIDIPIADAIDHYQAVQLDEIMVKTAKSLGIYLGELD
ncbi:MAG: ATP-dependent 6-phosphofructokinase [Alphaproteobacteria bacterium]|jgi:ATP-dependent phosphofructokinase / diphosphate-dependent phosphofructokinase|nr:ATP-dependent 6-phosphofructokinase [Alphaproteobacteria bacterium]